MTDLEKQNAELRQQVQELQVHVERLRSEIVGIMSESSGVDGYHLNGAVAAWDEFDLDLLLSETPAQSLEALKAQWQAEDVPNFIRDIGERLNAQGNRITSDPLFCVFEKDYVVTDEGYDHDRIDWGDVGSGEYILIKPNSEKWKRLEALYQSGRDIDEKYQRNAIKVIDKFVTAAFTEEGAKKHIQLNGHNLREPFVCVTSLFRTPEMIELRNWLINLRTQGAV